MAHEIIFNGLRGETDYWVSVHKNDSGTMKVYDVAAGSNTFVVWKSPEHLSNSTSYCNFIIIIWIDIINKNLYNSKLNINFYSRVISRLFLLYTNLNPRFLLTLRRRIILFVINLSINFLSKFDVMISFILSRFVIL